MRLGTVLAAVTAALALAVTSLVAAPATQAATAPLVSQVTPGNASLAVSWLPTAQTGDDTVVYVASAFTGATGGTAVSSCTKNTGTGYSDETTVTPLSCTIPSLTNGTSYYVEISATSTTTPTAVTGARGGPYAAPRTVPGPPTGFTATPDNAKVTLEWQAPANTGGAAITGYTVTRTLPAPAAAGCTTTVGVNPNPLTCTITGLSNGTQYTFSLVANNIAGPSTAVTVASTPGVAPGAPTGVTAQPGNSQATVTWVAPASTGSSALSGYTVTSSPGGRQCTTTAVGATAPPTTCTVTGLTNGTAYTFTVTASNATSTSTASTASAAITPVAPVTKTIEIAGERGTGKNRMRIYVDGVTTGFTAGTKLVPQYRFPGQRGFTSGTARPEIDEDGFFSWSRRAGKQIVVRFTTESGDVRSNPWKIPARR